LDSPLASLDPITLAVAAVGVLAVFLIGLAVGRASSRRTAEHARDLEDRLQLAEEEMNQYRAQVSEHFSDTSKLLRDLTLQYRNVYEHLAEGARTLCPEADRLLPSSFAEAALPAPADEDDGIGASALRAPEPAPHEPLPLALESVEDWHERAGDPEDSVEPLLDERIDDDIDAFDERAARDSDARAR
jgi:uncharacterized membrane-anchored protein YhcB (DUF1043 family)